MWSFGFSQAIKNNGKIQYMNINMEVNLLHRLKETAWLASGEDFIGCTFSEVEERKLKSGRMRN